MAGVRSSIDTSRMSALASRPGIDPRIWLSLAVVEDVAFAEGEGIFVDLRLQPTGEEETAFLGSCYAGNGAGDYCPLNKDDTVLVAMPSGDSGNGPIIIARYNSAADPPAADFEDPDQAGEPARDRVIRMEPGRKLKIRTSGDGDGVDISVEGDGSIICETKGSGKVLLADRDADQPFVRGTDYADAEASFVDSLGDLVTAINTAITAASATTAGGIVIDPVSLTAFSAARTAFKDAKNTYLSQKVHGK